MRSVSSKHKTCATCGLWTGNRIVESTGNWVQYAPGEKSMCIGGGFAGGKVDGTTSCSKHIKMQALK